MTIFDEIRDFGGERYAVHIGARSFSAHALSSLVDALSQSVGKSVQLLCPSVKPPYAVRLNLVTGNSESELVDFAKIETQYSRENGTVFLEVVDSLRLEFVLGVLDKGNLHAFSAINLDLSHLKFQIEASGEQLVCAPGEAKLNPSLCRLNAFDEVKSRHRLDPIEMARVEGMLRYSGLVSAVRSSVATLRAVDLRHLFPGIIFQGRIELEISSDKKQLFVTGSGGATRRPESRCECADVGDGIGPVNPGTIEPRTANDSDQTDVESAPVARIEIGGPSRIKADSVIGSKRLQGEGDNGLFMPVGMAKDLVDGPFPGIRLNFRDEGFVGWKAAAFIDFSFLDFERQPKHGRFFVTLGFRVEINGSLHVDLGKLGKIRVTTFSGGQKRPESNTVKIGFHAMIRAGELFLKPVLEEVSFGDFEVHMPFFRPLGTLFGTKGAVIGFILDKILGQLIAWQIPIRLERELRTYMASAMFPVMDAYYSAQIEGIQKRRGWQGDIRKLAALYNGRKEGGFLFSSGVRGVD